MLGATGSLRQKLGSRSTEEPLIEMKPAQQATMVASGVEAQGAAPGSAYATYGASEIALDPTNSAAEFCCPSPLSCFLSLICPFSWLGSCRVLNEKEGALLLTWGKFTTVVKQPGIYCLNPCGTTLARVSTKQQTTDLPNVKLLDLKGNPVIVSGVVFWQIEGVKAASLDVENVYQYVHTTALATLKQVVSKYRKCPTSSPSFLSLVPDCRIQSRWTDFVVRPLFQPTRTTRADTRSRRRERPWAGR